MEVTKEKLVIQNSRGAALHSELYRNTTPPEETPFVILCHGFSGDRSEWGRFPEAMEKLSQNGYDCLTFDFSGSGENGRELVTLDKQKQDLEDVFAWVKKRGYQRIATIGLSFGGTTLLVANLPEIRVAVYWAPGFYMKEVIGKFHISLIKILGKFRKKPIERASSNKEKPPILFDRTFIESILHHPPEKYLKSVGVPSLVVHGQEDKTSDINYSRKAIKLIPDGIPHRLVEIPGTGHNFKGEFLDQFIDHTLAWLNLHL